MKDAIKGDDVRTQVEEKKELENTVVNIAKSHCKNISSSQNIHDLESNVKNLSLEVARKHSIQLNQF